MGDEGHAWLWRVAVVVLPSVNMECVQDQKGAVQSSAFQRSHVEMLKMGVVTACKHATRCHKQLVDVNCHSCACLSAANALCAASHAFPARCPVLPQSAHREGASTTRLFRSLWLYAAMHKLVIPSAGTSAGAAGGSAAAAADVQWEWQVAAGRLAAVTPLLMVGTNSYFEADMVERLKVCGSGGLNLCRSLDVVQVAQLGTCATQTRVHSVQPNG